MSPFVLSQIVHYKCILSIIIIYCKSNSIVTLVIMSNANIQIGLEAEWLVFCIFNDTTQDLEMFSLPMWFRSVRVISSIVNHCGVFKKTPN